MVIYHLWISHCALYNFNLTVSLTHKKTASYNFQHKTVFSPDIQSLRLIRQVHGVIPDEPYTILKITQESTTQEVIVQALQKAGLGSEKAVDYILVEEVAPSWEKKDKNMPSTQRVLDLHERPLQAQANWQGDGRFILKRIGDDPSSRAWLSSIRSTANLAAAMSATDLSVKQSVIFSSTNFKRRI